MNSLKSASVDGFLRPDDTKLRPVMVNSRLQDVGKARGGNSQLLAFEAVGRKPRDVSAFLAMISQLSCLFVCSEVPRSPGSFIPSSGFPQTIPIVLEVAGISSAFCLVFSTAKSIIPPVSFWFRFQSGVTPS
ncbi:hypothetical protein RRG08_035497 [Elysia crispata]|uniref:Uncharacterized protein n=1 Tax=Elysia crispata TaxID=231223 RepID=A0AAE1AQS6_9GAST|nr:hypothetical protein RRG08_035497 [Elysia crispata]